jgi:hypothetical protein
MALATHFYGVRQGYRRLRPWLARLENLLTLETALLGGGLLIAVSLVALAAVGVWWSENDFAALPNQLPLLLAIGTGVIGLQTVLGGVLLAVIAGHRAQLTPVPLERAPDPARQAA